MDDKQLLAAARAVREHAHAPYSGFGVGAALRARSGEAYMGANVENASLGLSICAERSAVFAAVAAGEREFDTVAIVAGDAEPAAPCGACRQVLAEFNPSLRVLLATPGGEPVEYSLAELLAHPFLDYRRREGA